MPNRRDIRRLAMQVLYQVDVTGETDPAAIGEGLDPEHDPAEAREAGVSLALAAWAGHEDADRAIAALTPQWPTRRQPPVDRAILRLAHHEIVTGRAPPKVVINECVELAKQYAGEKSPPFINGVLDKLAKTLGADPAPGSALDPETAPPPPPPQSPDAWLKDAKTR